MSGLAKASQAAVLSFALVAQAAAPSAALAAEGAPVTFKYGRGVNEQMVLDYANDVTKAGCPATATPGGIAGSVYVKTNGRATMFTDPGDAAGWALDNCK